MSGVSGMTPYEPVGWDEARKARAKRFFPALLVLAGVVALGLFGLGPSAGAGDPTPPPAPNSPVDGVVIAVDSAGLGQVKGFVLRLPDATTITFKLGNLENATEFSPSHLAEHMASSEPVRAFFRPENGDLVVYRLQDAAEALAT
jgi:hypothetical protein